MNTTNELFEAVKALREQYEGKTYVTSAGNFIIVASVGYGNMPDADVYTVNGVLSTYREILAAGDDIDPGDLDDIWNKALYQGGDE